MGVGNIIVCDSPIISNRYEFLYKHLDCDCIADTTDEETTGNIKVIAYPKSKDANKALRKIFYDGGYSSWCKLLRGIGSEEVNSIG
jgi:hypothetical protein